MVGERAVPHLTTCVNDPQPLIRREVAYTLGQIQKRPEQAVPALIVALSDSDDLVREFAAQSLGYFGSDARQAVGPLIACLNWVNKDLTITVMQALGSMSEYAG